MTRFNRHRSFFNTSPAGFAGILLNFIFQAHKIHLKSIFLFKHQTLYKFVVFAVVISGSVSLVSVFRDFSRLVGVIEQHRYFSLQILFIACLIGDSRFPVCEILGYQANVRIDHRWWVMLSILAFRYNSYNRSKSTKWFRSAIFFLCSAENKVWSQNLWHSSLILKITAESKSRGRKNQSKYILWRNFILETLRLEVLSGFDASVIL